ncbi:hypothetical protein Heshes_26760 [Alicyclobacillus hesperidum]|uniref:Uncharacterized protein n=1 Tax=Alicyclobacillus hesperidum TaxID=89784 RepID=A0AA37X3E4_9BACL|nr:DUF6075 family protein [Alicyclobacillus hesperidum]GLV14990.1 hypothetical protein Heshes_26760 [Alicyclobacillus hesperidum]
MMFLSDKHEVRYDELLLRDGGKGDIERESLFFVLAGSDDLYRKADKIYDFEDRSIIPESLEGSVDLSSGARALVELAFNLYNSFGSPSVMDIFPSLDADAKKLAIEAIKLRFRMQ